MAAMDAAARCTEHSDASPPRPFVTDGCSAFPDGDWAQCCLDHDVAYGCGGTADERKRADARLSRCVTSSGHSVLGPFMYVGVRIGGVPWWPVPWRWGFGWNYGRGYDSRSTREDTKPAPALPSEPDSNPDEEAN